MHSKALSVCDAANSFELGGSEVSSVASHGSFMRAVRAAQAAAEQVPALSAWCSHCLFHALVASTQQQHCLLLSSFFCGPNMVLCALLDMT